MLTVLNISDAIVSIDNPAPNVFIDHVLLYLDKIKVFYHIADDFDEWYKNKNVIDNINLHIQCGETLYFKESLSSLVKRRPIQNGALHDSCEFRIDTKNLYIKAYCGNDNIKGVETIEHVLSEGQLVQNTYEDVTHKFINKYKPLYLLDIERLKNISKQITFGDNTLLKTQAEQKISVSNWRREVTNPTTTAVVDSRVIGDLLVSYNTNKNASIAFVFDLERYLEKNSNTYLYIKNYTNYKNEVLKNSYIIKDTIKVYKKNITKEEDYKPLEVNPTILKIQDGIDNNKFIITFADKNTDVHTEDMYSIKIQMIVNDYSQYFINNKVLSQIYTAKQFLFEYKELWDETSKNKLISNYRNFIFEQHYERYLDRIKNIIESLSTIMSFYTGYEKTNYQSLLLSIIHPLTGDQLSLDLLLKTVERLEDYLENIVSNVNTMGVPGKTIGTDISNTGDTTQINQISAYVSQNQVTLSNNLKEQRYVFEYEFKETNINGVTSHQLIDYNYDYNYGYEIVSSDNFDLRSAEINSGLMILTSAEREARKIYEIDKFFSSAGKLASQDLNYFSISFIDFGDLKYNFLPNQETTVSDYNELYAFLNQYNDHNFSYKSLESYYYQLLDEGVYIKTLGAKNNNSYNSLLKATVFDPNLDSKQSSLEFMASTGITTLYNVLDDNRYIEIPDSIPHYLATVPSGANNTVGILTLSDDLKNNPDAKPRNIITYNNIYFDKVLYQGNNYEIHELQEAVVNNIFTKKLRLFNKYYIIEKAKNTAQTTVETNNYNFIDDLKLNVPSKYLNRNTNNSQLLISTSDL